jgi:hypothetical protein
MRLNQLSAAEKKEGWKLLFDGQTLTGWRAFLGAEPKGWSVEDGCLKNSKGHSDGDIVTEEKFKDFDLRFEWRISPGGNSGVKYFVHDRTGPPGTKLYPGDGGKNALGHEYQIMDDTNPEVVNSPIQQAGALYVLIAPSADKKLKPVGEFNESRIVVRGKHVEHWLNGVKIVEYELESPELMAAIAKSKFKPVPGFGTKFDTRILLQDHGDVAWFRNLKIRSL